MSLTWLLFLVFAFIPHAGLFTVTTFISDLFCPHGMVEGMLTGPEKHVSVLRVLQRYIPLASCTYTSRLLNHPPHMDISRTVAFRGVHVLVCLNEQVLRLEGQ